MFMGAATGVGYAAIRHAAAENAATSQFEAAQMSAAADTSIAAPFNLAGQQAQLQGAKAAANINAGGSALTAGASLAAGLAFGPLAAVAVAAFGSTLTSFFAAGEEQDAAEASAAFGAAGSALSFRAQIAGRRASFDQQNGLLGMLGGGITPSSGVKYGLAPEEAMAAMMGFGQSAGFSGAFAGQDVFNMSRSGASVGSAGTYRGLIASGVGGVGDTDPSGMIGAAQASGLAGSKIDEYLGRIASATTAMAEQGLSLNLTETEGFMRRLAAGGVGGLNQGRAVAGFTSAAAGARQELLAPYADGAKNAVLMEALRGRGLAEQLQIIESIGQNPERGRSAILRNYGSGETALGMMAAMGNSLDTAQSLRTLSGASAPRRGARGAGGAALKVAQAGGEAALLNEITGNDTALFDAQRDIQVHVLRFASTLVQLLPKILAAMGALDAKVTEVINNNSFFKAKK